MPPATVPIAVIDAFFVETLAAAAAGSLVVAAKLRRRSPSIVLPIAKLPFRLRREALAVLAIAREQDARHPEGSHESFTAREALRAYLPETLGAYLAVPSALRGRPRPGRPSPDEELRSQLATLRSGLERLREADADIAAARMAQNAAFLHERFGPAPPLPPTGAAGFALEILDALRAYLRRA